jgi:hypothetical protein
MYGEDLQASLFKPYSGIRKVAIEKPDCRDGIETGIEAGKAKVLGEFQVLFISRPRGIDFSPGDNLDVTQDSVLY